MLKLVNVCRCMGYDASKGCNYAAYDACASKGSLRAQGKDIEEVSLRLENADWLAMQPNATAISSNFKPIAGDKVSAAPVSQPH